AAPRGAGERRTARLCRPAETGDRYRDCADVFHRVGDSARTMPVNNLGARRLTYLIQIDFRPLSAAWQIGRLPKWQFDPPPRSQIVTARRRCRGLRGGP